MDAEKIWALYVREVVAMSGQVDQTAVAKRVGVSQGTISRWLSGKYLPDKAAIVAHFARVYNRNVLEAFVAAGMLELEDAGQGLPPQSAGFLNSLSAQASSVWPAMAAFPDEGPIDGEQETRNDP